MDDTLPTQQATGATDELSTSAEGADEWTLTPKSFLTLSLDEPSKPDSVKFTPSGETPEDFDDVTFTVQITRAGEDEPQIYSAQGDDTGKVRHREHNTVQVC